MARRAKSRWTVRRIAATVLGLSVLVAVAVIWRRSVGDATAREMQRLETERLSLKSERMALENDLRLFTSRQRIVEEAERRLGMHVASEKETRFLTGSRRIDSIQKDSSKP